MIFYTLPLNYLDKDKWRVPRVLCCAAARGYLSADICALSVSPSLSPASNTDEGVKVSDCAAFVDSPKHTTGFTQLIVVQFGGSFSMPLWEKFAKLWRPRLLTLSPLSPPAGGGGGSSSNNHHQHRPTLVVLAVDDPTLPRSHLPTKPTTRA